MAAKAPEKTDDFNDTKYFHVMGCSLMASVDFGKEVVKTMHMLKEKGVKVSFDPNDQIGNAERPGGNGGSETGIQRIKHLYAWSI